MQRRLRILTWHVHGSYLCYLARAGHDLFLPTRPGLPEGYGGAPRAIRNLDSVHEIAAEDVRRHSFDCIVFQSHRNFLVDQHEILSPEQRRLPRIFLEHDPPREHPTDTRHPVDDPNVLIVHVTPFNELMWDCGRTPTRVIDHGVVVPHGLCHTGEKPRGVVVVNGLKSRGRRLGHDVFEHVRRQVPLDLVGMQSEELGGLGEIPHEELPAFLAQYRFLFNPIRYSSLGLSVCEAMMVGVPIVGLNTTEMASTIDDGRSGYVDTRVDRLIESMRRLLRNRELARRLGDEARRYARRRFDIDRFSRDWTQALRDVTGIPCALASSSAIHPASGAPGP